jgi:hypothetical protein
MKHFTMNEMTRSATAKRYGIDNTPSPEAQASLKALVEKILDPLREAWGQPIIVSSGYRCGRLNKIVKGSATSQHMLGEAADIHTVSDKPEDNRRLFQLIQRLNLPYDQLIDEYGYNWIHVSYGPRNRHRILHLK